MRILPDSLDVISKGNAKKDVTELDRLSFTVRRIEALCAVVPKDSYKATPNDELVPNLGFRGLKQDGLTLANFRHFRDLPQDIKIKKKVENGSDVNFLDDLEHDIPANCWSLKIDASKLNVSFLYFVFPYKFVKLLTFQVQLTSTFWQGFVAYARVNSPIFGYAYFGDGMYVGDFPFIN